MFLSGEQCSENKGILAGPLQFAYMFGSIASSKAIFRSYFIMGSGIYANMPELMYMQDGLHVCVWQITKGNEKELI